MKPSENWNGDTALLAEQAIGYTFRDKQLLITCFTHKSYANQFGGACNERLEFLGDAVLQLIVTESLYHREDASEGDMTEQRKQYVSQSALTVATEKAKILPFLRYAGGSDAVSGKTPSNLFEAVTAGIYLDGGMHEARAFARRFLTQTDTQNYKTLLQELVQSKVKKPPEYCTRQQENSYYCTVSALGKSAESREKSKKLAETQAAKKLYQTLIEERK